VLPQLPEDPAALFFYGAVSFLMRKGARGDAAAQLARAAKDSFLRVHEDPRLLAAYRLNARDFLATLYQEDGEHELSCSVVEGGEAGGHDRCMLMARARLAMARSAAYAGGPSANAERLRCLGLARKHLERALAEDPTVPQTYCELDIVLEDLGERQAQLRLADRCVAQGCWWERRLQRPAHYLRGLTAKPWWNAKEFEICRQLERSFEAIRAELQSLVHRSTAEDTLWRPVGIRPTGHDAALVKAGRWNEVVLYAVTDVPDCAWNRLSCPETVRAIESCEDAVGCGLGEVFFSHIVPGTKISPHCGPTNMRLTCHLGLVVPKGCSITVGGGAPRTWEDGKCLVFDDSFEHSVANDGRDDRYVLVVNFWHPRVPQEERLTRTTTEAVPSSLGVPGTGLEAIFG